MQTGTPRHTTGDTPTPRIGLNAGSPMDWQNLTSWLAPVGRRWDIAFLANLPPDGSWASPAGRIDPFNDRAAPVRKVSRKVLEEPVRRLHVRRDNDRGV